MQTSDPTTLASAFEKARLVQSAWAERPLKARAKILREVAEVLIHRQEELARLVSEETGKPEFEAYSSDIFPSITLLPMIADDGPDFLSDKKIAMRLLPYRKSKINYWPLGVVSVISPWNYPFMLAFADIAMALFAGNAVIFKPSEWTQRTGQAIQDLFDQTSLPAGLLQTFQGDGKMGQAILENRPDKVFFTGSVATGKKIAEFCAKSLTPVNLELGGNNPMIVLSDAHLDHATSAALWGGFCNAGQACGSVQRIFVHESIRDPFTELLKTKVQNLRSSRSAQTGPYDIGRITLPNQANHYEDQLSKAREAGVKIEMGGHLSPDRRYLEPTVISGPGIEDSEIFKKEFFGPMVAISTFRSVQEAITKANETNYGLVASVFSQDRRMAESVARKIQVGTVLVNEVLFTAGLMETPWGGLKDSGLGRTHSLEGLKEFVHARHINSPISGFMVFKALWWFPYTPFQYGMFRALGRIYSRSWSRKLRALPELLWNFVQFLKNEPRV
ncbi:MAG: aldehyde dehydrogenase family protein [Bdellovibrionales bacterium]|nr:aldehyde dehydrogenase family protein [Bdellovibrionales bacterium]